jgi:hypothetical protein
MKATDFLGAHRVETSLEVEAEGPGGKTQESLQEELLVDSVGGYHVIRRERAGAAPWELICVGSSYYVIDVDGRVQALQPGMLGQTTRERVAESWRTVLDPFRSALKLVESGKVQVEGREGTAYDIQFVVPAAPPEGIFPASAQGRVVVDDETRFPLDIQFTGSYSRKNPTLEDGAPVQVKVKDFRFKTSSFGKVSTVEPPAQKGK